MLSCPFIFFFNDTATTEIYTLSLHDALPISSSGLLTLFTESPSGGLLNEERGPDHVPVDPKLWPDLDRKSTRLNSSHANISYAVFCLKKKNVHSHRPGRR